MSNESSPVPNRHLHEYELNRELIESWGGGKVHIFCPCGGSMLTFAADEKHFHITERSRPEPILVEQETD